MLMLVLVISTGEMVHGQLLKIGESLFSDPSAQVQYFMLRADPASPTCDIHLNVDAELQRRAQAAQVPADTGIDDLFAPQVFDEAAARTSIATAHQQCLAQHQWVARVREHLTGPVKLYRTLETSFFALFDFGAHNRALILLMLLCVSAAPATLNHHHICLRPPRSQRDHQVQSWSMLLCGGAMLYSALRYQQISLLSGVPLEDPRLPFAWMGFFAALTAVSAWSIWRPSLSASAPQGTWREALPCVPLIANMGLLCCAYFFTQGHPSGPAIYASKVLDFVSLPLALALHIWAGMLFKQSRMVDLFMNILRPWKLSPEALTYVILLAAGLPTAYAGVSSVFVIAAGAIVYHEVRAVGGTSQYALAATAMSGSLGVVLSPSLLVVGIAAMNKQVTTSQLFHWGAWVFALTSTLFFVTSQWHRHQRHQQVQLASPRVAIPAMWPHIVAVLPYVAVVAVIALFYKHVLDTPFNDISAPSILPIMMLLVLVFDRFLLARQRTPKAETELAYAAHRKAGAVDAIGAATHETVSHVGAYICLMLFTQLVGGVVERSEVMAMAPQHFPNVWLAMGFLVVAKVVLGTVMEPLGAIVLVSSTLAPMAYANGIDPVHFWMMVLVAFELGYLLPPVALNQLLTRQVVGEAEIDRSDAEVSSLGFARRHERWILPCAVMSASLLIVAFGPLAVQRWTWLQPWLSWMH